MKTHMLSGGRWAWLIITVIGIISVADSHATVPPALVNSVSGYGQMPLRFEPNSGQTDPQVRYISRGNGYSMYFLPTEIALALDASAASHAPMTPSDSAPAGKFGLVHIRFLGGSTEAAISPEQTLPEKINYFTGSDPAKWHTGISVFGKVRYQNLYPGVNLVFYGNQSQLEYDFEIAPNVDVRSIKLELAGADQVEIETNGDLAFSVQGQTTRFHKPTIYQTINGFRHEVTGCFHLNGNIVSFGVGAYDPSHTLIIDPVLSYSTFLGGTKLDEGWGVAVDGSGNAYVAGQTLSLLTNIVTGGALQTNFSGGSILGDAFVAKIGSGGTNAIYITYLGGSGNNAAYAVAVDVDGHAYVAGDTDSTNFPVQNSLSLGAYSGASMHGVYNTIYQTYPLDGFVTKLETNGSSLIYSSYLGGSSWDNVYGIALDAARNAYVTGLTYSSNFPVTVNAVLNHLACTNNFYANYNAFVTEISSNGTTLAYSTYLGGTNKDEGQGITVDASNFVYVTGWTTSYNFPTTNAVNPSINGGANDHSTDDAFMTKFSPGCTGLVYSTFLGGKGPDTATGIGADASGNAYVVGQTFSTNFPTTNALQGVLNGNGTTTTSDAFITKLTASGQLAYSTFLGGSNTDSANGVQVQSDGEAVIVGQTGSIDFAPYANYGSINSGNLDGFVAKLSSDGQALVNFAYLGGTQMDNATGVAIDSQNNAYVVGYTASANFPITLTNVVDPNYLGATDAFLVKLYFEPNQLGTEVYTTWQNSNQWTVIGPPATMAASNTWSGTALIPSVSSNGVTSLANDWFQRGVSYDPTYTSFVIPLNQQTGFRLDDLGNNSENFNGSWPWFTRLQNDIRTHLSLIASTNGSGVVSNYYGYVTNFNNPIAAFGATAGNSPLYVNEQFKFGVYCGAQYETTNVNSKFAAPLRILVYNLSSFVAGQTNLVAPIATNSISIPRRTIAADAAAWQQFATNGFSLTIETNGLRTTVQLVAENGGAWGVVPRFTNVQSGTYVITHECTTNLGYGYVLEGIGVVSLGTNVYPMVTNSDGAMGWDRLYSLDFQPRSPWRSVFIDQPQFAGQPLPSFYQAASLSELTNLNAVVTNAVSLTNGVFATVDDSPELRRHPTLDQFVASLNNDPVAIANYVVNEIELTDALAYNENNGQASAPVLNEGGVNRSALDVYLEGQGSPVEQCALLVYLLRQAGYPAAFMFPTNNNVQMLDSRLSALLRMQLHGAANQYGQTYTTNTLITVNYPWVVTTISNQTVHIFPWLKDTQITEGFNLYDYMPTNYDNGYKWLSRYLYGDTNILGLSAESDAPSLLFPRFVKQQLLPTGLSLSDIGIQAFNRTHYYSRWQDFPTPSVVNNPGQSVCADSLTSITNALPGMTNVFNAVTLSIYSQNNTNTQLTVGPLRMADLHNREMFMATNGANGLMLWLAPYIPGNTNQSAFDITDPALTNLQIATLTLATNDVSFAIQMTHYRHQAINFSPSNQFLGVSETLQFSTPPRPFNLQEITAVCFNVGRVTPAMIDVHAQAFQQMSYQWSLNTNMTPAVSDYQGAAAYMMGMDYYSHVSQFLPVCEQLHKAQVVSWYAEGLSRLTPVQLGAQNFMRPSMDMFYSEMAHAGNGTSHPDSGNDPLAGTGDFAAIMEGEIAAQEHNIVNGYYQSQNSVSAVVLLRLAQQRLTNGVAGIIELNRNNYLAVGVTPSTGYGPTKLQSYDSVIWAAVTNAFQGWDADYVRAYITPGPVSLSAANYRGMGLVIVGQSQSASLISVNMNGVQGAPSAFFASTPASLSSAYSISAPEDSFSSSYYGGNLYYGGSAAASSGFDYYWSTPDWYGGAFSPWPYVMPVSQYQVTATFTPPSMVNLSQQINDLYSFPQSTPVQTSLTHALDSGNTGSSTWKNLKNYVYDPVNIMSGEFYHDSADLMLAGPQPFSLHRNYSSQNQDDRNCFGYGWNINVVPYLGVSTNATTNILTAVELDGSVIAYRQQTGNTNLYLPVLADNLQLDNFGNGHIGSVFNPFNGKIVHSFSGTNELYTLTAADGQIRTYIVNSFPVSTPTNTVSRQRPYLANWQDTQGNSWAFTYGTNSGLPNYGSVTRIQCSNGNYLGLDYNAGGYVIDAYTSDGERTDYEYDDFGDLVYVERADDTEEAYEYQHVQYTNNGTIYVDSTHLLIFEFKPDGRTLQNNYDTKRRVTTQLATVGTDLNLYTNAVFTYSNNFTLSKMSNGISGFTLVKDVNGNTNRYDYLGGLVTTNTDVLGQKTIQNCYADTATAPGYPRSLYQTRDKRGLWTQFLYDANGNVTNSFSWGDLTGDGTIQYATNTASYNGNNLPVQVTDPVGNLVQTAYHPKYPYLPQFVIYSAGGTATVTNQLDYGNATNVVVNGSVTLTNIAFGLLQQQILAANSPDAATNQWSFDGRGYLMQSVQFTGTGDPAVINYFTCNDQGEIIERKDSAGQRTDFEYDAMRRPISHQVFATGQANPMFWEYAYYNDNGELNWYDGPRYNPEDYQWRDYDGAGRLTTQIRWRSEAKADGTGMEAPAGYNLYAQSFYQYDKFGNLTLAVDPRGACATNQWDALGRLVQQQHLDTNGVTLLSSEGFAYEPGGLVKYYTNALGGVTTTLYATNGLPEYRSNPDGSTNAWRYYLDGRIKREIQSNGAYWQTTYDDVNRITTRILYSAAGTTLATNSVQLDRRGNTIQRIDESGNVFTTTYDDLDRAKVVAGPVVTTVSTFANAITFQIFYVTNVLQQAVTNFYDAAGQVLTNVNVLGEKTVTCFDALGRATQSQIYSASGTLVRQTSLAYSPNFNSVTVTSGSGAGAITSTSYTDNDGQNVLTINNPSTGVNEFMLRQYDLAGNLVSEQHDSSAGGTVTTWTTASFAYDGLNRPTSKIDRDGATTTYAYDPLGDLIKRTLPGSGSVQMLATNNNAGQKLKDWLVGGTSGTRTNKYTYFAGGSPFAGLLQTKTDGRNTTCTYAYDDWLRVTNMSCAGSLPEQNLTNSWQYEPRGYVINYSEQFASTNTGPSTSVQRTFDAYGQLASESVSGGSFGYGASQTFDGAGRRSMLNIGGANYGYGWQADGSLVYASNPTGTGSYAYNTAGILTGRQVGNHVTSITSLDGEGRPLTITNTVNTLGQLGETLAWSPDGLLTSHTLNRSDFTDNRSYSYANLSRRVTQEQLNLNAASTWTNSFVYDRGVTGGPGALTTAGPVNANFGLWWSGIPDAFSRVNTETNNAIGFLAYGFVNGQSTLTAYLDNQPIQILSVGTNNMQWRTFIELSPGAHQLKVSALHPSGFYTAWATNSFTNNIPNQVTSDAFDGSGNITNRVFRNASGATNRTQSLSYDAKNRLLEVMERNTNNYGFNWFATYDGLNRRIATTTVLVSNGVSSTVPPQVLNSYFDPQVAFLELGVMLNAAPEQEFLQPGTSPSIQTVWKLYGPDLNSIYGGMNGAGGLEGVSPYLNTFTPVISDARGNVLAEVTNGATEWTLARPTGYGSVPGYRPVAYGNGVDFVKSSVWRGREVDVTGYYHLGLRDYDPVSGQWLSYDPMWNASDPNGQSFCGGDPVNEFDPDGRMGVNHLEEKFGQAEGVGIFAWDTVKSVPHIVYEGSIASLPEHARMAANFAESPIASFKQGEKNIVTAYRSAVQSVKSQAQDGAIGRGRMEGYSAAFVGSFFVGVGETRTAMGIEQVTSKIAVADARTTTEMAALESVASVHPGAMAAASSDLSQASILRALRANGSPEALAAAKLISNGRLNLDVVATDPLGQGAAGRYFFGTRNIAIASDAAGSPMSAAGFTAHEARHFLQNITPSTYTRAHEFDAYLWQRAADDSFNLTDEAIWQHIRTHPVYQYVPE